MPTSRREFLALTALWQQALAAAQSHVHPQSPKSAPYRIVFFTPEESRAVEVLAARIIPPDDRSGGAPAARVHEYIDFILSHAPPDLQKFWRYSLARISPRINKRSPQQIDAFLTTLAQNEFAPTTPDEAFFVALKDAVVEAFYTSEEGIRKELRYAGNAFLTSFPGCTHATHETPATYRPLLKERREDA